MILQSFVSGKHTAPAVLSDIKYENKNSFDVTVHQLAADGFLSRKGKGKKPYTYTLTKKGRLHSDNPFLTKEWRRKRILQEVDKILMSDIKFREAVERIGNQLPQSITSFSGGGGGSLRLAQDRNGDFSFENVPASENENTDIKPTIKKKPIDISYNEDPNVISGIKS